MDIVKFLEQLASNAHYRVNMMNLVGNLPEKIKNAFLMNDTESLKKQISDNDYFANESYVVKIQL